MYEKEIGFIYGQIDLVQVEHTLWSVLPYAHAFVPVICTCGLRCWIQALQTSPNTNGMNFNEGNNEQPCVPDAHGFSSLTVNSSQKRQEVEEMVFSERYFETRGPTAQRTTSKIITS